MQGFGHGVNRTAVILFRSVVQTFIFWGHL
jgi:hypothetical protein